MIESIFVKHGFPSEQDVFTAFGLDGAQLSHNSNFSSDNSQYTAAMLAETIMPTLIGDWKNTPDLCLVPSASAGKDVNGQPYHTLDTIEEAIWDVVFNLDFGDVQELKTGDCRAPDDFVFPNYLG